MQFSTILLTSAAALALAGLATAASAQDASGAAATQDATAGEAGVIALSEWSYEDLYAGGWSAEELIDEADVIGSEGEEIGDIENILVSEEGRLLAVILEMGGFLDLGDTHIMAPWDQVEMASDLSTITAPANQDNAEEYSMYGATSYIRAPETEDKRVIFEDVATGPRVWQVTELIDDYALLDGGAGYGYVDDLVFSEAGELAAVVVSSDFGYGQPGLYAYPFYGYGFEPGAPYYELPYSNTEVVDLAPFDSDQIGG